MHPLTAGRHSVDLSGLGPPGPLSAAVGADRHARVRAVLRRAGVAGLVAVSTPEDMQAGDYLTGQSDGLMGGAIVYLPLDGEPFAFAPPDLSPVFPALWLHAAESAGAPGWVTDWLFGPDGVPDFVRRLGERTAPGAAVGGVHLVGTPIGDYLRSVLPRLDLVDLTAAYDDVRSVRLGEEAAGVRSACAATEAVARILTTTIADGVSEAEVTGLVNTAIGRHGIVIGDVPLASVGGYGAPPSPTSWRGLFNVGNSFDATWRSRGLRPRVLRRGQLITSTVRCWAADARADLHLTVSIGPPAGGPRRMAVRVREALDRACAAVEPGLGLGRLHERIATWLGVAPDAAGPYCYLLNPTRYPPPPRRAADVVLREGMHLHLNPHLQTPEAAVGVGCDVLVGADGAERLTTTSGEVHTA